MSGSRLAGIAAAGYLAFALAFALNWRAPEDWDRIDLDRLSRRAAQVASEVTGLDVSGWIRTSAPRVDHGLQQWRRQRALQPIDRMLSPLHVVIAFRDPLSSTAVELLMSPEGPVRAVRVLGPPSSHPEVADLDQKAEQALRALTGGFAPRFERETRGGNDRGERFRWKAASSDPSLSWRVNVNLERNRFHSAFVEPVLSGAARRLRFFDGQGYDAVRGVAFLIGVVWAVFACISGWARSVVDHRLAWTAAAAMVAFDAAGRLASGEGFTLLMLGGLIAIAASMAAIAGAGRIAASSHEWPRWQAFALFLRFQWNAQSVGKSIAAGMAWAGVVAAVPFLIAGLFPDSGLNVATYGGATLARIPVIAGLAPLMERGVYGLFIFFAPMVFRRFAVPRTAALVMWGGAALGLFLTVNPFSAGIAAAVASACVAAMALTAIYWLHGLLAVLAAFKVAMVLTAVAGFLTSGSKLLLPGVVLLLLLAAAAAAGIWVARNGRHIELEDDRNITHAYLSAREKLKAEFSLAHQAQQRMLPSEAPPIEGFTLAAACLPARDVGGDLYDYFALPDGRLGICVADVSGKGMSAALYMTLTKGVLAAVSPECSDLAELSGHLNRHLYAAGKRKVFVTAVLAAVDAAARTVEFVRAGHNPILLHSAASGHARYLAAKGMGLGMTGGSLFGRATSVERIALEAGDSLVLYSDGVTEAMNSQLELYGEERLKDVVERDGAGDAAALLAGIRADVAQFTGSEPAHDDITIVVLQAARNGQEVKIST